MKSPLPGFGRPLVIAHRGASATHPENTVAAFDAALSEGCDGLELDLQLSRDGVPLVYHDRTLRKIGGGSCAIRQVDWPEIATLDAGGWRGRQHLGQRVPSLDQVLERYGRRTQLLLEIKARPRDKKAGLHLALARALVDQLRRRRLTRAAKVVCFDLETLEEVTAREARISTVLNLKAPRRMTPSLSRAVERVSALSIDVRTISGGIVNAVHDHAKPVFAYTCNTPRTVTRALAMGVDGLLTDRPGWLREILRTASGAPRKPGSTR